MSLMSKPRNACLQVIAWRVILQRLLHVEEEQVKKTSKEKQIELQYLQLLLLASSCILRDVENSDISF